MVHNIKYNSGLVKQRAVHVIHTSIQIIYMTCGNILYNNISLYLYISLQIHSTITSPTMEASATSKLLVSDIASSVDHVPSNYVRPISDRPNLSKIETSGDSIPMIDLQELHGSNRADVIYQVAHACASYGFFQATPCLIHYASLHCTSF